MERIRMKVERFQISKDEGKYDREVSKEQVLEVVVFPEEVFKLLEILRIYSEAITIPSPGPILGER